MGCLLLTILVSTIAAFDIVEWELSALPILGIATASLFAALVMNRQGMWKPAAWTAFLTLGPVEITGDAIAKATAAYRTASQTQSTGAIGWLVTFQTTKAAFWEACGKLVPPGFCTSFAVGLACLAVRTD